MNDEEQSPFYDSIEEYEVNDDRPIKNCDLHDLPCCSTCLFGRHDTLSEPIRNKKGIENEEYNSEET